MEQVSKPQADKNAALPGDITEREMDVIRLVAKGRSNQEIASELVISEKTVKTHMSNILSKLALEDRTQVAIYRDKKWIW